jgi:TRAP-type transport system small permease protein
VTAPAVDKPPPAGKDAPGHVQGRRMRRGIEGLFRLLEFVMVALLAAMVAMVLGNVVLRYVFDSGIAISEEMSRYCFVWLTFIGAVVVYREHAHLGVDTLVKVLPALGRRVCLALSDSLALLCCAVFFWGTWKQQAINASNVAPISGLPMTWVYGVGYFTSLGIGVMILLRLIRLLTGRLPEDEVRIFAGDAVDERGAGTRAGLD